MNERLQIGQLSLLSGNIGCGSVDIGLVLDTIVSVRSVYTVVLDELLSPGLSESWLVDGLTGAVSEVLSLSCIVHIEAIVQVRVV